MKEESKEPEKAKLVGTAAKAAIKQEEIKAHDEKLYREHG